MGRQNVSAVNKESPAIAALADALEAAFPSVVLFTTNNESPGTRHTSGLAIDIMLDVNNPSQRAVAHAIIDVLVARHSQSPDGLASLTWSDLIYSDISGGAVSSFHIPGLSGANGYGGTFLKRNPYTQDQKHRDHIHVDWVDYSLKNSKPEYFRIPYQHSESAKQDAFRDKLTEDFKAIAARLGQPAARLPVPPWLPGWWEVGWRNETYFYFFQSGGTAAYTKSRPAKNAQAPATPQDRGTFWMTGGSGLSIIWKSTGTVETFGGGPQQMQGKWNNREILTAKKL
jgi:hypothetical protein